MKKLTNIIKTRSHLLLVALAITGLGSQFSGSHGTLFSSTVSAQEAPVMQLRVNNDVLSGEALGEFEEDEPGMGSILAREHIFYTNANDQYSTGIWEAKPGTMTIQNSSYAEVMYNRVTKFI